MRARLRDLFAVVLVLLSAPALQGAGAEDGIRIDGAYARAVPPGQPNSAVFLTLTNTSDTDHALVAAESPVCEVVELHTHRMEDGIMRMRQIDRIGLPARSTVRLAPGGLHIMLIGLRQDLHPGDEVPLELLFGDGARADLVAPVRSIGRAEGSGTR